MGVCWTTCFTIPVRQSFRVLWCFGVVLASDMATSLTWAAAGAALRLPTLIDMGTDVATGMAFLETHEVVHRDLAARNILVGAENNCKVADFGLARMVKTDSLSFKADNSEKFPVRWTAPEAMAHNRFVLAGLAWAPVCTCISPCVGLSVRCRVGGGEGGGGGGGCLRIPSMLASPMPCLLPYCIS